VLQGNIATRQREGTLDRLPRILTFHSEYGISLGAISIRGEVGALVSGMDSLARLTSNPWVFAEVCG